MSACISRHGEFGSHELGEGRERFACQFCGVFDEDAALDEIARLRAAIEHVLDRDVSREHGRRYLREALEARP